MKYIEVATMEWEGEGGALPAEPSSLNRNVGRLGVRGFAESEDVTGYAPLPSGELPGQPGAA